MPEMTRRRMLATAGTAVAAAFAAEFLPPNVTRALAAGPPRGKGSLNDIKHVVILMQENRSFDHYFGTLPGVRGFADPAAIKLGTGRSGTLPWAAARGRWSSARTARGLT
jgi:phospholipase C